MRFYLWSLLLAVGFPLVLLTCLYFVVKFPVQKVALIILLVNVPIALVIPWFALRFSNEVQTGSRKLSGGLGYSVSVSEESFGSRTVVPNASALGELVPARRTNGIGLPGLAVGHFELANGRKAIVFVHDTSAPIAVITAQNVTGEPIVLVNERLLQE